MMLDNDLPRKPKIRVLTWLSNLEVQSLTFPLKRLFFQAEDGIRDLYVTGVQTCALPISTDGTDLGANIDTLEAANTTTMNGKTGTADAIAPTVTGRAFGLDSGLPFVAFTFSEAVASSIRLGDLSLTNLDSPTGAKPTVTMFQWLAATNTARFYLDTTIPDGNFRATLAGVTDSAANAISGSAFQDFFFLKGDSYHECFVKAIDLKL